MRIGLFGAGAYGLALSSILNDNRHSITMWTKSEKEKERLRKTRKNEKLLPGYVLDKKIELTNSVEETIADKDLIIIAIPAVYVDSLCREMAPFIKNNHILIATKGIEQETGLFMNEIVEKYLDTKNIAVISGGSFAIDIIDKKPIGLSLASKNNKTISLVREALGNDYIKLRDSKDIIGVEICGSIKNVIALAAGMLDGLEANDSTKAMLLTEAIYDMEAILHVFHCNKRTVMSFAGMGDLLLTCNSIKSRNYRFGKLVGEKKTKKELDRFLNENTVEGHYTLESIYQLLRNKKVTIPIIDLIYDIVVGGYNPEELLTFLVYKS